MHGFHEIGPRQLHEALAVGVHQRGVELLAADARVVLRVGVVQVADEHLPTAEAGAAGRLARLLRRHGGSQLVDGGGDGSGGGRGGGLGCRSRSSVGHQFVADAVILPQHGHLLVLLWHSVEGAGPLAQPDASLFVQVGQIFLDLLPSRSRMAFGDDVKQLGKRHVSRIIRLPLMERIRNRPLDVALAGFLFPRLAGIVRIRRVIGGNGADAL